jgi:hypothetical protein
MSEAAEQRAFFRWLSIELPSVRAITFAIPNGGSRHPLEAKNLKMQGVTAGVPDIFVAVPSWPYNGLFIEMKYGKNRLSPSQRTLIEGLLAQGYRCAVCYSWLEARDALLDYLKGVSEAC